MERVLEVLLCLLVNLYCVFDDEGFCADEGEGEGVEVGDVFGTRILGCSAGGYSYCSQRVYGQTLYRGWFPSLFILAMGRAHLLTVVL